MFFRHPASTSNSSSISHTRPHTVYPKKYAHSLCFVVAIHWLIFPYPSGLLHWHCGNLTIAPVPAKQPWWIWINTSCEFIMNDCITTTKQSTTKPCAYFLGYTVSLICHYDMKVILHTNSHADKMTSLYWGELLGGGQKGSSTFPDWGVNKCSGVIKWMQPDYYFSLLISQM